VNGEESAAGLRIEIDGRAPENVVKRLRCGRRLRAMLRVVREAVPLRKCRNCEGEHRAERRRETRAFHFCNLPVMLQVWWRR